MKYFISFHPKQRKLTDYLSKKFYNSGHESVIKNLRVLLGEEVINQKKLFQVIGELDYVLPIISKEYLADDWLQKELNAFKSYEVNFIEEKLILPIIYEDCEIPEVIKNEDDITFNFKEGFFDSAFSGLTDYLSQQRRAFIVMKMNDDSLELAYRDGILQALKVTNYDKRRIDDYVDGDKISPRILKEIRRSDVVIADLTDERPNCYYEVGYAHALGKKVILSAKQGTNVHFDLKDNNFIFWKSTSDLKDKLIIALQSSSSNTNVKIEEV